MDEHFTIKPSLFDDFLDEINNENEYCDIPNDEKSMGEMWEERGSIINLQDTNLDESNNCDYGNNTVKCFFNYKFIITMKLINYSVIYFDFKYFSLQRLMTHMKPFMEILKLVLLTFSKYLKNCKQIVYGW